MARRTASKQRRHERELGTHSCPETGKLRYSSRKQALTRMNATRRAVEVAGSNGSSPTTIYKCPFCRAWHMTSQVQR